MQLLYQSGVFIADGSFAEKHIPKNAGFWWHRNPGHCIGVCAACEAGLGRYWWTADVTIAAKLGCYATPAAERALQKHFEALDSSRAEDVDDVDAFHKVCPAPAGLDYMPYQRAGIMYALQRPATILGDTMGLGKGLTPDTPVLTPRGWRAIGALREGDRVCDPDGGAAKVEGVYPQAEQPIYRVTFSDGEHVDTDGPHRWLVYTPESKYSERPGRVLTTCELMQSGLRTKADKRGYTNRRWFIPVTEPVTFDKAQALPMKPYALGALLGDGSFRQGSITVTTPDTRVIDGIAEEFQEYSCRQDPRGGCPTYTFYNAISVVRDLGLIGKRSEDKLVPAIYLRASIEDRLSLLQGLMDTDGDCTQGGVAMFNTSSPQLMEAVVDLVRSLGGIATVGYRPKTPYTYKGETRHGLPAYRVNVRTPMNPFRLPRKAQRWHAPILARGIESIEEIGTSRTVCISVSSKRNLFIAQGHIVTHNTIQGLGVLNAKPDARRVLILCPASLRINWAREAAKWLVKPWDIQPIEERTGALRNSSERLMVIVNYDRVGGKRGASLHKALRSLRWDVIICDEAHYLKNDTSQRSRAVLGQWKKDALTEPGLIHGAHTLLLLTGTPITNRPRELFPLARACDGKGLGSKFFEFAIRYCNAHKENAGNKVVWNFDGASNLAELQERLRASCMIRRLKEDVLKEMPPKRRQIIELPQNGDADVVSEMDRKYAEYEQRIQELEEQMELAEACENDEAFREAAMQLKQIRGIAFHELARERKRVAMAKAPKVAEHVKEALEAGQRKVLVFAHHKDVIALYEQALAEYNPVKVTGSTSVEQRQAAVDALQTDDKVRVFLGNIQAAGVGLTLTEADLVVFGELDWVPANMLQAEDRAHRIGQDNPVLVQMLVYDASIDSKMAHSLASKMEVIEQALDAHHNQPQPAPQPVAEDPLPNKRKRKTYPKLTEAQKDAVISGLQHLAGRCDGAVMPDGVGFNKLDTRFGHELAKRSMQRDLTPGELWAGRQILRKYRRQFNEDWWALLFAMSLADDGDFDVSL